MSIETLYSTEESVTSFDIEVPAWIEQDINCSQVAAIIQGGCDSGAYMPAVTYHQAADTMNEHGDDVLDYIESQGGELSLPDSPSWSGIAVHFLSTAVEFWASRIDDELSTAIEEKPRFVAGWNNPGYMPDSEPEEFATFDDALEHIRGEVLYHVNTESDKSQSMDAFDTQLGDLKDVFELTGPNGVVYWVRGIE